MARALVLAALAALLACAAAAPGPRAVLACNPTDSVPSYPLVWEPAQQPTPTEPGKWVFKDFTRGVSIGRRVAPLPALVRRPLRRAQPPRSPRAPAVTAPFSSDHALLPCLPNPQKILLQINNVERAYKRDSGAVLAAESLPGGKLAGCKLVATMPQRACYNVREHLAHLLTLPCMRLHLLG